MAQMRQQPRTNDRPGAGGTFRGGLGYAAANRGFVPSRTLLPAGASRRSILSGTIEHAVIPHLVEAHAAAASGQHRSLGDAIAETAMGRLVTPTQDQVDTLVDLVLRQDQRAAASFVDGMLAEGTAAESLYLDLLAPTARRLGIMWAEDECDIADVTVGLIRLQHVMRELMPNFLGRAGSHPGASCDLPVHPAAPRALLIQMPGEQHGMGLAMVSAFFRRAGWNVATEPVTDSAGLLSLVRRQAFGVVGISVSCSDRIERLAADIEAIRHVSCNPAVGIMVGGPPFVEHPQLAQLVGADATAVDGRQAVQQAHLLIAIRNATR